MIHAGFERIRGVVAVLFVMAQAPREGTDGHVKAPTGVPRWAGLDKVVELDVNVGTAFLVCLE